MKLYSQRNKYAQNNLLAASKNVLRSPLELYGTYGSKFMLKNNYREYLFQQFISTLLPFQTTRILLLRAASVSQNYDGIAILIFKKIMAMSSL